jgi:hypothetical protein
MNFELDANKISEFRSLINSEQNFFINNKRFRNKWNLVCAIMDRLDDTVALLNNQQLYESEVSKINEVITSFVYSDIIVNSIVELYNYFNISNKYPKNDSSIFDEIGNGDGNDDAYFRYLRALIFAHPIGTNRHPIYIENQEIQYCPFILNDGKTSRFRSNLSGQQKEVAIRVYSNIKEKDKIIYISLNDLKRYVQSRFNLLNELSEYVKDFINNLHKQWSSSEIKVGYSPLNTLGNLRKTAVNRHDDNIIYFIDEALRILKQPITNPYNIKRVEIYRKRLIASIYGFIQCYQKMDNDGINASEFLTLLSLPRKGELNKNQNGYRLEKIKTYLQDYKHNNAYNVDWGYAMLEEFKQFSNRYVIIDDHISYSEIQLLVDVAMYSYLEENKLL